MKNHRIIIIDNINELIFDRINNEYYYNKKKSKIIDE
jgi:hypothetical protein